MTSGALVCEAHLLEVRVERDEARRKRSRSPKACAPASVFGSRKATVCNTLWTPRADHGNPDAMEAARVQHLQRLQIVGL